MTDQFTVYPGHRVWSAIVLALIVILHWHTSWAAPFELSSDQKVQAPGSHLYSLEDPTGQLSLSDMQTGSKVFHPQLANHTSLGVTASAWWFRLEAHNPTQAPIQWVLNYPFPLVDLVDFFVMENGQFVEQYEQGDKRPRSSYPLLGEGFAVPLTTGPGNTTTVYVRTQNLLGDGLDAHFEISSPREYFKHQLKVWIFLGFILGGGIVLLLYNTVIYLVVRDDLYIWYLLYLVFVLGTFLSASGLGHQFGWWSHQGFTSEALPPVTSALALLLVIQFSRKFLDTKIIWPRIDPFLRAGMVYFLLPPLAFFTGYSSLAVVMVMVGSLVLTGLPVLGAYAWISGQKAAPIFTLAWGFWFASLCSLSGRILGFLPTNDFTLRIGWIGILGEAVLFALAMADRIRILRREKNEAEAREHAALQKSKSELEALVHKRTRQLESSNDELRRINSEKDKLFSIIAHDLRNPIHGIIGLSDILIDDIHKMSREEIDSYLRDLRKSADIFHTLLENLLSWALLQLGGVKFRPETLDLRTSIEHCTALFAQSAHEKGVTIETRPMEITKVYADAQMLETIVRNLISNAIKYSQPGGRIILAAERNGASIEVSVSDEGVGMDPQKMASLFNLNEKISSPGTNGEQGTGLGLQVCKEFVERQGGTLTVESEVGHGTTFRFSLPQ